jgi:hyperosmotically inducible protein
MTGDDARSAGDRVSDQALETKVKSALIGDDRVKARNIEVEVRNGGVSLAGTVDSSAEAQAAVAAARQVSGVSAVNRALTVRPA